MSPNSDVPGETVLSAVGRPAASTELADASDVIDRDAMLGLDRPTISANACSAVATTPRRPRSENGMGVDALERTCER